MGIFDGIIGTVASGIFGAFGQQQTNEANADIAQSNNAFNASQAAINRDFQSQMSNTQYQRATADMKAAGLNPMLAYQQGGAGTPSGSSASAAGNPVFQSPASAGSSAAIAAATVQNMREQNDLIRAQVGNVKADTLSKLEQPEKVRQDTATSISTSENLRSRTHLVDEQVREIRDLLDRGLHVAKRDAEVTELDSRSRGQLSAGALNAAREKLVQLEAQHEALRIPESKSYSQLFKDYPWLAKAREGLKAAEGIAGSISGGVRSFSAARGANAFKKDAETRAGHLYLRSMGE